MGPNYQELVRIKDVLAREFSKLDSIVGPDRAHETIMMTKLQVGIVGPPLNSEQIDQVLLGQEFKSLMERVDRLFPGWEITIRPVKSELL